MKIYLIDTNIMITPQQDYYCNTFHSGFWDFLKKHIESGQILIIQNVYDELVGGNRRGYISEYLNDLKNENILNPSKCDDEETQQHYSTILNEIVMPNTTYSPANKENFCKGADPHLIAKAKTLNATVVTLEKEVPDTSQKIKIPNVCRQMGVSCITLKRLLDDLSPRFILG